MYRVQIWGAAGLAAAIALASPFVTTRKVEAGGNCLPNALRDVLGEIEDKFGGVKIISTYRQGATMPNGNTSFHASCRAVDFNPPSGKYDSVAKWLKANHDGGVGTYSCGMHHIHIDNGPRIRFHHCQGASNDTEMDAAAIRAARADWPTTGVWPVIIKEQPTSASDARL